jgi:hypothetical protein
MNSEAECLTHRALVAEGLVTALNPVIGEEETETALRFLASGNVPDVS